MLRKSLQFCKFYCQVYFSFALLNKSRCMFSDTTKVQLLSLSPNKENGVVNAFYPSYGSLEFFTYLVLLVFFSTLYSKSSGIIKNTLQNLFLEDISSEMISFSLYFMGPSRPCTIAPSSITVLVLLHSNILLRKFSLVWNFLLCCAFFPLHYL